MNDELKAKISAAYKDPFIGNYCFKPEELSMIYEEVGLILRKVRNCKYIIQIDLYDLVFVSLVNLTKEWNEDEEAYFNYVYRKLIGHIDGNNHVYNEIKKVILLQSGFNKIFIFHKYKKKYYASLCSHAFAPVKSMESFFDMCWEIYCKDLYLQYMKNDPIFTTIAKVLQNKFAFSNNNDDKDIKIGSKVYSIRMGIRGLAIEKPNLMVELLDNTMSTINCLFYNIPIEPSKYLNILIFEWWNRKKVHFGLEKQRVNHRNEQIVSDYSKIQPRYVYEQGDIKLVIPSIRLSKNIDINPHISIHINSEIYLDEEMDTIGSGVLMYKSAFYLHLNFITLVKLSKEPALR